MASSRFSSSPSWRSWCSSRALALAAGLALGAAALPAAAADPCAGAYSGRATVDLAAVANGAGGVSRLWGSERMHAAAGVVTVDFPKGSINPGNKAAPEGGAGFLAALPGGAEAACLGYDVRLPAGFAFAKGGKLPGLYGGEGPTGCAKGKGMDGFSARLMWRAKGAGEVYLYAPEKEAKCGVSIGRGKFRFATDRWVRVTEEIVLGRPGVADGRLRLWIDGTLVVARDDLLLREQPDVAVGGAMFSTFFGGDDPAWASPADQSIAFRDMVIYH